MKLLLKLSAIAGVTLVASGCNIKSHYYGPEGKWGCQYDSPCNPHRSREQVQEPCDDHRGHDGKCRPVERRHRHGGKPH